MNKFVVADIDADVAESAPHRIEKYQVTGPQFALVDGRVGSRKATCLYGPG